MAAHGLNKDGDYTYHHCAVLQIRQILISRWTRAIRSKRNEEAFDWDGTAVVVHVGATSQLGNPPKPKPAFAGQTDAPGPAKPSPAITVETITTRLSAPWSLAFLPDGNFLVNRGRGDDAHDPPGRSGVGTDCRRAAGQSVAAQGLHDVVLDPDFAHNRLLYFTYFAPPRGEEAALWPNEFFYEKVWTKSLAERRTMDLGMERVARARLVWTTSDSRTWRFCWMAGANAASSSHRTARCWLRARTGSVSTIRTSTAWSTISRITPISAGIFQGG